ncbi:MAG TPA: wax ester/triacylglycerol synthase family O-acyltransferase [Terriglobales bacterium]|nr:wax ester/triacylglycerol synthase family O-acyltransferase [Terriglobales bacterium]
MTTLHDCDCLSFGDSLFLSLERQGMPLHMASLSIFEGRIALKGCLRYVHSKLPLIPRYRQRVVAAPLNLTLPSWQPDPEFDLRNHIREVRLRQGTEKEMRALAARILSTNLDRERPLWDMTLLTGLSRGRTGVLTRVHHCMADGLSGVELMNVLMDHTPEHARPSKVSPGPRLKGQPAPSLLECFLQSCLSTAQRVFTAESELLTMAERVVGGGKGNGDAEAQPHPGLNGNAPALSAEELNRILPQLLAPAQRLPFNIVCRGPQKFECAEVPLATLKQIKHACGVSLNDVVLGLVTYAVYNYASVHNVRARGRSLRIVVPVSIRRKSERGELGNHITFVPVTVPLHRRRVRDLVFAAHEYVQSLKRAHVGELVGLAGTLLGAIPAPLQAALGPVASQLPLSVCNLICTNVPGPHDALYLLGHKMLACYPYVPIGGEMGMNCAMLSYDGTAYFGFTGDVHAVPDLASLPKFLLAGFARLQKEIGIRAPRPVQARPAATVSEPVLKFPGKKPASAKTSGQPATKVVGAAAGAA